MSNKHKATILSFVIIGVFISLAVYAQGTPQLSNPLPIKDVSAESLSGYIGNVIGRVLGISGAIALMFFVYGGFLWMFSAGSPDRVKKGRDVLIWATLGLVLIFSSYAILKFVFGVLGAK